MITRKRKPMVQYQVEHFGQSGEREKLVSQMNTIRSELKKEGEKEILGEMENRETLERIPMPVLEKKAKEWQMRLKRVNEPLSAIDRMEEIRIWLRDTVQDASVRQMPSRAKLIKMSPQEFARVTKKWDDRALYNIELCRDAHVKGIGNIFIPKSLIQHLKSEWEKGR